MKQRTCAALSVVFCLGAVLLAQQRAPAPTPGQATEPPAVTFRLDVNYVEVDASVTDAQGKPVTSLTANDFEVFEDGKPQTVTTFSLVNIPIRRADQPLYSANAIEPDVQTNQTAEGRIYLLVLDDLHTDPTRTARVRESARRFVLRNFGTNDLAAVVFTRGRAQDSQDFTNNRRLLLAAIDKFIGQKPQSLTITRLERRRIDSSISIRAEEMERESQARSAMGSIRTLAEFMAGVRGRRKALLLFSEGVDYDVYQAVGPNASGATTILQDTHNAIAAATRGNVAIYAIDPRGLSVNDADLITAPPGTTDNNQLDTGSADIRQEVLRSQDSLRVLAENTGGFTSVNTNNVGGVLDRIVSENSTYYLLGFYSTNDSRRGRLRKLDVRVKTPGLRVRARAGYYEARGRAPAPSKPAPADSASPAVADSLGSPIPVGTVPLTVNGAAFRGVAPDAAVALAIEVDVSKFNFVESNGTFTEQIEVVHTATDAKGKVFPAERHALDLALKPDTYARTRARGLRVLTQAILPPGRYQIRVAAGNRSGTAGSVLYDLEVPDFFREPFTMSGVALTSRAALTVDTIAAKNPLADFLPGPQTAGREFATSDTLALFAEFYENAGNAPAHMVDLRAELREEGGRVVREVTEQRSSTELQGESGGYGFTARIPLNSLAPGLYVLRVEGRTRIKSDAAVSRAIQIRIR